MNGAKQTINLDEPVTLCEMFDYLCSRVNWGKAALDADAINCMNQKERQYE